MSSKRKYQLKNLAKNNYTNTNYSLFYFQLILLKNILNFFFLQSISKALLKQKKYYSKHIYISQV